MNGVASVLPLPPLDADGDIAMFSPEIAGGGGFPGLLRRDGRLHGCVGCHGSTITAWWPAELATGERPDPRAPAQWAELGPIGLHPRCVPALLWEWTLIVHGRDGAEAIEPDEFAAARARRAATSAMDGTARRRGAYGRRGS